MRSWTGRDLIASGSNATYTLATGRPLRDADGAPREGKPLLDLSNWSAD
jgi:hypothetical protein